MARLTMRGLLAALLVTITGSLWAQAAPDGQLSPPAQRAVARVVLMRSIAAGIAKSEESYFPQLDRPVLITWPEEGRGITVGVTPPPPAYTRVSLPWTTEVVAVGPLSADFSTTGINLVPFSVLSDMDTSASGGLALRLAFHEADHAYMQSRPTGLGACAECQKAGLSYPIYDAENSALAQLEARLLIAAYEDRAKPAVLRRLARDLVAVRRRRYQRLSPLLVGFEQYNERNEGLAEYCSKSALRRFLATRPRIPAALLDAAQIGDVAAAEQRTNQDAIDFLSNAENVRRGLTREWAYHTGPAMGYMLDALRPGWLREIEKPGVTFWSLLQSAAPRGGDQALRAVEARYHYTDVLQAEQKGQAARHSENQRLAEGILGGEGTLLIVDFSALPGVKRYGFDPRGSIAIGNGREIHPRFYNLSTGEDYKAAISQRVLVDRVNWSLTTLVPKDVRLEITSAGKPLLLAPGERVAVTDLQVSGSAVKVSMAAAEIVSSGNRLNITAEPR